MTRPIEVQLLDAFAAQPFGGNVAGMVLDAAGLGSDLMARIAAELNAPTTGFVSGGPDGTVRLRFFTPRTEIDMCGHVTLAAGVAMHLDGRLAGRSTIEIETASGLRRVDVAVSSSGASGSASLHLSVPELQPAAPEPADVAGALGAAIDELDAGLPMEIAHTGLRHLIVGLRHPDGLARLVPDAAALDQLSAAVGVDTIVPFALDGGTGADVRCRDFCVAIGALEEAASGTTNSGLAAYLHRHALLAGCRPGKPGASGGEIVVRSMQGVELGRPSRITTRLELNDHGAIRAVRVEGTVYRTLVGTLALEESTDRRSGPPRD